MEALSPTMEEGQIVQWLKNEGDQVSEGDVIAEIETDKATMELVARGSGVLRKQLVAAGESLPVGAVIGVIASAEEDISALVGGASGGGGAAGGGAAPAATESGAGKDAGREAPTGADPATAPADRGVEERMERQSQASTESGKPITADEAGREKSSLAASGGGAAAKPATAAKPGAAAKPTAPQQGATGNGSGEGGRVKASPLARRLAADAGLDLAGVAGSGPGGRIIRKDVEAASAGADADADASDAAPQQARPAARAASGGVEEIRVSQMRKTIAKRLVESIGPVPTFYLTIEVDMTRMSAMRESMNERLKESGAKISVNDLIIKATAAALKRHPEVNSAWGGDVIRRYHNVDIGVAVAVEDGLITPIVRNADAKGAAEIGAEVRELAGRAREKKLQPDEYTGATFSISNLGMFGIDEFTAIINPPEAAILAIGRVEEKPVFENGRVVAQPRMRITMSCDHRVIDGATGAKFLQTLRSYLEEPMMMIA